jgi:hypothetical protein
MSHIPPTSDAGEGRAASLAALLVVAALTLAVMVSLVGSGPTPRPSAFLVGTWLGDDGSGGEVVYHFGADGRGYRVVDRARQEFAYTLVEGYPHELRLRIRIGPDSAVFRGLVQRRGPGELALELGGRNLPPPYRLTSRAVLLHHPPAR